MAAIVLAWLLLQADPVTEARRHAERGDFIRAIAILSQARQSAPTPPLLAFLAQLQASNDQIPQAADALAAALELAPNQHRWRTTLGALYFRLGRLDEARVQLQDALRQDQENPISHYYLAAVNKSNGELDEARRSVGRALSLMPIGPLRFDPADFSPRVNALHLAAEIYAAEGELAEAEKHLRDVLRAEPTHSGARYLLGRTLQKERRTEEAARQLELFRQTKKAQEHLELGLNLSRHAGDSARAIEELRQALDSVPDHPRALYFLALTLLRSGEREEAVDSLERVVELRPEAAGGIDPLLAQLRR